MQGTGNLLLHILFQPGEGDIPDFFWDKEIFRNPCVHCIQRIDNRTISEFIIPRPDIPEEKDQ